MNAALAPSLPLLDTSRAPHAAVDDDARRALVGRVRAFHVVYAILVVNFAIPAVSYIVAPSLAIDTMSQVNAALGGGVWPVSEETALWHMLAVGNVATLAFACFVLLVDVRRFFSVLPVLAFLKGFSALFSLAKAFAFAIPGFFAVFALDGVTTLAMIFFAVRARSAFDALRVDDRRHPDRSPLGLTLLERALLLRPAHVHARLALLRRAGVAPLDLTSADLARGALRMWSRVLFRSHTVGTSRDPVRRTWRARVLRLRVVRFFALVVERAIAPFDMTGLASSSERVTRHLLGAHHEGAQRSYDLELLGVVPGALLALRDRARAVVDGTDPRSAYLRDLVVFEGYHEALLADVERALAGERLVDDASAEDPDLTLRAFLAWCREAPALSRVRPQRSVDGAGIEDGEVLSTLAS